MRKTLIAASLTLAATPAAAAAKPLTHTEAVSYGRAYAHVAHVMGKQAAGCKLIGPRATCRRSGDRMVRRSTDTLQRMFAPPPPPAPVPTSSPVAAATTSTYQAATSSYTPSSSSGGYSSVPGVPAGYAACVAYHESTNGAGSSNIYGIIPASGSNAGSGSIAEQKAGFAQLYAQYGTKPWQGDGC